ncbi:MAG: DUF924 family protein [Pseudomonadota bacterium]
MVSARDVIDFWCVTCEPKDWYRSEPEFDDQIRATFGAAVETAQQGGMTEWEETADGLFGLLILLDQFSRNIFRGQAQAFVGDMRALALARSAVSRDIDQSYPMPERQFFLLPFLHSEELAVQDEGLALMQDRLGPEGAQNVLHAHAHRAIIERFGRFPYRNDALGRDTTKEEQKFLDDGSYGAVLREMQSRYPAT